MYFHYNIKTNFVNKNNTHFAILLQNECITCSTVSPYCIFLPSTPNTTCGKLQAMKTISAIYKAKMEARSIFLGLTVCIVSFGIALIIS